MHMLGGGQVQQFHYSWQKYQQAGAELDQAQVSYLLARSCCTYGFKPESAYYLFLVVENGCYKD